MFERGKIILVPFPFTDLSAQKLRPALIISNQLTMTRDVIVAFISSALPRRTTQAGLRLLSDDSGFKQTGLKTSSALRLDKVATVDKHIVLGEIGQLSKSHMKQVDQGLKYVLGLK